MTRKTLPMPPGLHARQALLALILSLGTALAQAALPTLCVWDPIGRGGKLFGVARSYSWAMEAKGFKLDLKAYSDESVAVQDFKVGQCDGLLATSLRTRHWVSLPTALDYPGAATIVKEGKVDIEASYQVIGQALKALATPQADRLVLQGEHEVAGIVPIGATYLLLRDRTLLKRQLAGARMPAFDNDKLQLYMIAKAGGVPVAANSRNFGTMFNNGNLDVVFAPALAFQALELHKGLGKRGGVSRFPLAFSSLQIVVKRDKFPKEFGRTSRLYWADQFKLMTIAARKAEATIPAEQWIDFEGDEGLKFVAMQRESRVAAGKAGHYHPVGLSFMKRVRCQVHPNALDCAKPDELVW